MCNKDRNEETIFNTAVQLKSPAERDAYLSDACQDNNDLRVAVEDLLKQHDMASFLDVPPVDSEVSLDDSPISESPGTVIGRYKLLEKIGEGGMAVVYMAEQEQPIRRKVALKIIKLGMDTQQVIARFEAERQALALMDHPHIAKVLDAGATETGRPYFVMELVQGLSITQYCDQNKLSTKERLTLFMQVCNAIQHAHQKGIIHRDIKPTNVMVTQHEGTAVPKVIDFGIAKATDQRLTEKTLFTRYAHIIGTPVYMSPEQAELSDLDIDTRSDIYSLGVLLYELLTGTTPFSEEELHKAGYLEMQRMIREQEPPRPSTRVTQLLAKSDGARKFSTLYSQLSTDLDWIVMKSLEKARDRRYDNASALVLDVQRHLNNEPVSARAPSATYRLRKFLRRHRSQAVAVFIVSVLVVALSVVMVTGSVKQYKWDIEESLEHKSALSQGEHYLNMEDYDSALREVRPILSSKHVKREARRLHDRILAGCRDKVRYYMEETEANPKDATNYFYRAQCYSCLDEHEKARSDMTHYVSISSPQNASDLRSDMAERLDWPVNSPDPSDYEWMPRAHADGLSLTVYRNFDERHEVWRITRTTVQAPWSKATRSDRHGGPPGFIHGLTTWDSLEFYIWNDRPGGHGDIDIYVKRRQKIGDPWSRHINIGEPVNPQYSEALVSISPNGLELYFSDTYRTRPGGCGREDIWVAQRTTRKDPWKTPKNLGPEINSAAPDSRAHISADGLRLFFDSKRAGGHGEGDIYVTRRRTLEDPWERAVNLGPKVNSPLREFNPGISPDGGTLFFVREQDIWHVTVTGLGSALDPNDQTGKEE